MIRPILQHPDPALAQRAAPVTAFDDALRALAGDLVETMRTAPGVGLAAPQVGVLQRVIVVQLPGMPVPQVLVNPEVVEASGCSRVEEGCLSLPGVQVVVPGRGTRVHVEAKDLVGRRLKVKARDLYAVALQHEIDHLDGKVVLDRLGPEAQARALEAAKRWLERQAESPARRRARASMALAVAGVVSSR